MKRPKTKLGLPDLDHSKAAVLDSLRSPESKRGYRPALDEFIEWYSSETSILVQQGCGDPVPDCPQESRSRRRND
jgi:hypothetical protein